MCHNTIIYKLSMEMFFAYEYICVYSNNIRNDYISDMSCAKCLLLYIPYEFTFKVYRLTKSNLQK